MVIDFNRFPVLTTVMEALQKAGRTLRDGLTEKDLTDCEHFLSETIRLRDVMEKAAKSLGSKELAGGIFRDDIDYYINQFESRCLKQPVASPASATTQQSAEPKGTAAFWTTPPQTSLTSFGRPMFLGHILPFGDKRIEDGLIAGGGALVGAGVIYSIASILEAAAEYAWVLLFV